MPIENHTGELEDKNNKKYMILFLRSRIELRWRWDTFPSIEANHCRSADYQSGRDGTKVTRRRAAVDEKHHCREKDVAGQQTQRRQNRSSDGRRNLQPPVGSPDARNSAHKHIVSFSQHPQSVPEG